MAGSGAVMKAVTIVEPGKTQIIEIEKPEPGPEEVLVRIRALGLCGTDYRTYLGGNPLTGYPRIPGHEIAAEILETGSRVPDQYAPGTAVTLSPYTECGKCSACLAGRVNCCRYNQTLGAQRDGAATEYLAVPYRKILTGDSLSFEQLAMVEPFSVGWHAATRGAVGPGDTVLVFGCGVIGLGALVASHHKGAETIAVDIDNSKLMLARKMGADHVINSDEKSLEDEAVRLTDGHGPRVVIEAVGLPRTFRQAVDIVSFAGRVVYIGYSKKPVEYETSTFVLKELDIRGSRNALMEDFQSVIRMFAQGDVDLEQVITHRFDLLQIGQALELWKSHPERVTKILAIAP